MQDCLATVSNTSKWDLSNRGDSDSPVYAVLICSYDQVLDYMGALQVDQPTEANEGLYMLP